MSPQQRRLVILANSRKGGSRCVAGFEIRNRRAHDWIRPVDSAHGTVANYFRQYEDGGEPALGDVLTMSLHGPEERSDHQHENWWLDTSFRWRKDGKLTWPQLCTLPMSDDRLWPDEQAGDSGFGLDNRVRFSRAQALTTSLRLIRVEELQIEVVRGDRERLDGAFSLAGRRYRLSITDPVYEQKYHNKSPGSYPLGECLLTISLGAPFAGFCYKLIAGIIERGRYADD